MRRLRFLIVFLGLVLAACATNGQTTESTASTDQSTSTSTQTPATSSPDETPSPPEEGNQTTTTSGRPLAPDFTLALGEGGSYTLSEETNPVYLVFWAEW